jgi:hypothetical protein
VKGVMLPWGKTLIVYVVACAVIDRFNKLLWHDVRLQSPLERDQQVRAEGTATNDSGAERRNRSWPYLLTTVHKHRIGSGYIYIICMYINK